MRFLLLFFVRPHLYAGTHLKMLPQSRHPAATRQRAQKKYDDRGLATVEEAT